MHPSASERDQLASLLIERSLRRGDFVLASGARSDYYIDARTTTMSGRGQYLIGRVGLAMLDEQNWQPDTIGGLTLGADPVAYAIAHAAAARCRPAARRRLNLALPHGPQHPLDQPVQCVALDPARPGDGGVRTAVGD